MKPVFRSDFLSDELTNWQVEQHVPNGYLDFSVKNRKLTLHDAGNRLLPNVPELTNFIIKGRFDVDWDINDRQYSLQIHFGYDRGNRRGLVLDVTSNGRIVVITLSIGGKKLACKTRSAPEASEIDFEFSRENQQISVTLNGDTCFFHQLERQATGVIALGRGSFLGELRLSQFEILSDVAFDSTPLWHDVTIPFAPINGMDIPIIWTVNASNVGEDIYRIDVELSGGEKSRSDVPWFPYHAHYVEFLEAPYLRVESANRTVELLISDETFILAQPTRHWFYTFHHEPTWPFKRAFFVRGLEADSRLFAGYRSYGNRPVNKHQEIDAPYETVYDTRTGAITYAGPAIPKNALTIDLLSPDDKRICAEIPENAHDYDKALAFARKNHYFTESEECRFRFELTSRIDHGQNDIAIRCRLENAFFEPLDDYQVINLCAETENVMPDVEKLCSDELNFGKLAIGVYHVRFQLFRNTLMIEEKWRAFEVNGEDQSALDASKMPVCFSMHNEVKGCDTDYFDPWKQDCVDVSHYIKICNTIMPHFAREKRLWELVKVYHRKWFLWHADRVLENCDVQANRDLIEHCDFICAHYAPGVCFRPAARGFFSEHLVRVLHDYAVENDFRVERVKEALDNNRPPDKETYDALVKDHYVKFLDYVTERYMGMLEELKSTLKTINPQAKYSAYGFPPIYISSYKTANSLSALSALKPGRRLSEIRDGFTIFEDYPHSCNYSVNRGPFLLADLKMRTPGLTIYPEMYNLHGAGAPCPDAAVARVAPSYGIRPTNAKRPLGASMKRVLEFVYASVWHDGAGFDYWRDHGFQTRAWERTRYETLLKLWGFIVKCEPARPLKANAFISSEACYRHHQFFYDEYPGDQHEPFGDLINTAEECVAYTYEMSREAGQNAGFVAEFNALKNLAASDIDTLVLPPLVKIDRVDLANIRRLHQQGVSLLAFEEVAGLEDLFGVKRVGETKQVNRISVNQTVADNPLKPLEKLNESTEHRACVGKYLADEAQILLDGEMPVLFRHQTQWGKTALFNIPPTVVRRQDQFNRVGVGRDNISPLINQSTQLILKFLSNPEVETDAGKLIAFKDADQTMRLIIEEDAHPMPSQTISPLVTLNLPGVKPELIHCDRPFSIISNGPTQTRIRLNLNPDEYAIITIKKR